MFRRRMPAKLRPRWICAGTREAESAPLTDALDQLERWVLSLPWVEPVLDDADGEGLRAFAVVCPPLGCDTLWLLIADDEGGNGFEVNVVLPRKLGRRGVARGWAVQLLDLSREPGGRQRGDSHDSGGPPRASGASRRRV